MSCASVVAAGGPPPRWANAGAAIAIVMNAKGLHVHPSSMGSFVGGGLPGLRSVGAGFRRPIVYTPIDCCHSVSVNNFTSVVQ